MSRQDRSKFFVAPWFTGFEIGHLKQTYRLGMAMSSVFRSHADKNVKVDKAI
ncbi:MAG: hypothetical protein MHPSP_004533, partial [Paramarteilia canceri]